MRKHKIFSIITLIGYSICFLAGVLIAAGMLVLFKTSDAEGIEAAALAVITVILTVGGGAYAVAMLIPLILSVSAVKKFHVLLPVCSLPFDLMSFVVNIIVLRACLFAGDSVNVFGTVTFLILMLISLMTTVINTVSAVSYKKPAIDYEIK